MYGYLARNIIFPAGEAFLGTSMLKCLKTLEETQWWPPEKIRELQNEKLRALVRHAYQNVPYYRNLFEQRGLSDKDIQTVEDLKKLPVLTKDIIRANFSGLVSGDFDKRRAILDATGGSTGEPVRYYLDMKSISMSWASTFRAWEWAGYKLGDKRATLAGSSLVPDSSPSLAQRMRNLFERNLKLSAFNLNERTMSLYAGKLKRYQPRFLRGYASALSLFASYLEERNFHDFEPRAIFSTAETLLPQQREVIERQFKCQVYDNYGANDGGSNACECGEHRGYHLAAEKFVIEIEEAGQPVGMGQTGEFLVTDLHNYAMPFIRYAVGDRGSVSDEQCTCGRGLPVLKSLQGRVGDFIVTPGGTRIHGEFFSHIFWEMTSFKQFQVVQESQGSLLIKVVPHSAVDQSRLEQEMERIVELVRGRTESMRLDVQQVDKIAATAASKYRFIIRKDM